MPLCSILYQIKIVIFIKKKANDIISLYNTIKYPTIQLNMLY